MTTASGSRPIVSPYVLLLLTMCFRAGNTVVSKAVVAGVPPAALVFWSWLIGIVAMSPWALPHVLARRDLVLRNWLKLVPIGLLGMSVFFHLFYNALTFTTAINVMLISTAIPAVILGLSWLLYREAISWRAAVRQRDRVCRGGRGHRPWRHLSPGGIRL